MIKKRKNFSPYVRINWNQAQKFLSETTKFSLSSTVITSSKDILIKLAQVGSIGLVFAFPGATKMFQSNTVGLQYDRFKIRGYINRLAAQKRITIEYRDNGSVKISITKKGLEKVLTYELEKMKVQVKSRWDKKWRVVIFDIPEKYKKLRDLFRIRLQQMGLFQFQKSVFVSPYPCFDEIEFLRELYGVTIDTKYLLVEKIVEDDELLRHFNLT